MTTMTAEADIGKFGQLLREFQVAAAQPSPVLGDFTNLLESFGRLPQLERRKPKTLLEIAGFPRRELPYSNILAFLLDPNKEHGMGDLLLRSLLEAAGEAGSMKTLSAGAARGHVKVFREDPTEEGKRIDIVVETDSFVLGVENKIEASLNNPLDEYQQRLKERADQNGGSKPKTCCGVLLHVRDEKLNPATLCGFKQVAYKDLFSVLRKNLGDSVASATPKHLFYLLDLMETVKNLELGADMMDRAMIEFFEKNREIAYRFDKTIDELRDELKRRGKLMKDVRLPYKTLRLRSQELDDRFGWCTFFTVALGSGVSEFGVQVWLDLKGWKLSTYAFYEKERKNDWVEQLFKADGDSLGKWEHDGVTDTWVYREYPYQETEETVRSKFQDLINHVGNKLPAGWKPT
jgi:hypothetical protein